jgi:hypothetical protein
MSVERAQRPLDVVGEAKIADLLPGRVPERLEASGVCLHDDAFHVIFDNTRAIARIAEFSGRSSKNRLLWPTEGEEEGFETSHVTPSVSTF